MRVSLTLADRSGSVSATAFARVALVIYAGEDSDPMELAKVKNHVGRGWTPTFLAKYDVRVKSDFGGAGVTQARGRTTVVAARVAA